MSHRVRLSASPARLSRLQDDNQYQHGRRRMSAATHASLGKERVAVAPPSGHARTAERHPYSTMSIKMLKEMVFLRAEVKMNAA